MTENHVSGGKRFPSTPPRKRPLRIDERPGPLYRLGYGDPERGALSTPAVRTGSGGQPPRRASNDPTDPRGQPGGSRRPGPVEGTHGEAEGRREGNEGDPQEPGHAGRCADRGGRRERGR